MKVFLRIIAVTTLLCSVVAQASTCKNDPGTQFAMTYQSCGYAISACEGASGVSDPKTGETGYCPGEWKDGATSATGMGLWRDCIGALAKGQNPALGGVTSNPQLQASAKSCAGWHKAYCAQNSSAKGCSK